MPITAGGQLAEDALDGLGDTLAQVPLATVTELDGLVFPPGGCARGNGGAGEGAVVQDDLDLDRRVSPPRIENLARTYLLDDCHD